MDVELDREIKNLFPLDWDELEEDDEVRLTQSSFRFQLTRSIFITYMNIGSFTLRASINQSKKYGSNEHIPPLLNVLTYQDHVSDTPPLFASSKILTFIWKCKLTRPIYLLLLVGFIAKLIVLSVLRFRHDFLLKSWLPKLRVNATNECALIGRLSEKPENIRTLEIWLKWLGDPSMTVTGGSLLIYQFVCGSFFFLFVTNIIILRSREFRFDSLAFLLDPVGERKRIRAELYELAIKIFGSSECSIEDTKGHYYSRLNFREFSPRRLLDHIYHMSSSKNIGASNREGRFKQRFDTLMKLTDFVIPANLTSKWFKLLELLLYLSNLPLVMGILFEASLVIFLIGLDLFIRVQHRLTGIRCKQWRSDAISIVSTIQLDPPGSVELLKAYQHYDGSISYLSYLTIIVEPQISVNMSMALTCILLLCTFCSACQWITISLTIYTMCLVDKLKWSNQLDRQLKCCADFSRLCYLQRTTSSSFGDNQERSSILVRISTITYLNYMLFRSQYLVYLMNIIPIVKNTLITCYYIMTCSYIVVIYTENRIVTVVLLGISAFIFFTNFIMLTGASLFGRYQKMMKHITRLITYSTYRTNSSNHSRMMQLWLRQKLDLEEVEKLFAFKVLGNYISYEFLVSVNVYLAFLWMLLFRNENDKK